MAGFSTGAGRPLQGRGGSPGFRFALYAIVSIAFMILDQRFDWLERAHYVLQATSYPVELAVSSPVAAWRWVQNSFASRDALEAENGRLRAQLRDLELRSMRYDALAQQNAALLGLRNSLPPAAQRWLPADIVNIQLDSLRQRVLIDRGSLNEVTPGQAVLDDDGVVGQTMHVGPWSAQVILITDPEHALPVSIARTGLRTIAVGAGDATSLALPYLPANADVHVGDVLVTSGLGGVFPPGYPVARVTEVHKDTVEPLAHVRAMPFAHLDTDREVMLIWFRHDSPVSPLKEHNGELTTGDRNIHPLSAPVKPQPAAATVTEAAAKAKKATSKTATSRIAPSKTAPRAATSRTATKAAVPKAAPAGVARKANVSGTKPSAAPATSKKPEPPPT
ncbi:MAG TPA: rod shape-determining protein MreC [Steroidobacteraceae bacterium]|nr:rod shape-determining protein MreC [Steroidobacteraceae bacterium]